MEKFQVKNMSTNGKGRPKAGLNRSIAVINVAARIVVVATTTRNGQHIS